ncbi:MAG: type II toxin-antitoxin system RelE/ParE family toxin [Micromonosporaceae bacterium]|nr:type II toxin-antitoxin system RelE/ParE family toxin [Micromonosporaceae bacterium]
MTDLAAVRKYYADARPGLDEDLAEDLDHVFARLVAFPFSARLVSGYEPVRRAILRRFPYAVFYLPSTERIEVLRIVHTAQAPGVWRT